HSPVNVGTLLADGGDHATGTVVEAVARINVADLFDDAAHDLGYISPGRGGDLARDQDQAGRRRRLAGHAGQRVLLEQAVKHAVADLVAELVGVPLGNALAGEESLRIVPETAARHRLIPHLII